MAVTPNYVKFTRGTPTAYKNLQTKDPDTLYFISEKDADTGILYLGTKVIAGGDSNVSITSLSELTDVLLSNNIEANSLLIYDEDEEKWINKAAAEVFELIASVMVGATADAPGKAGLVPIPQAGDHTKVLMGDGTWSSGLADLTAVVTQLVGDDINMSVREIAENVFDTYVGSLDDLKEIIDWLEENPDFTDFNTRLNKVEGVIFDQGSVDDGTFVPGLQTTVGTLQISMKEITQEITNIYERLTWQEMDDDTGATN
jgi:hypothetical protein